MSDDATRTSPPPAIAIPDQPSTGSIPLATQGDGPSKSTPIWPSIPGYEILEQIGHGGMGVVFRAREIAFDRDVAIKLLSDHFPHDSPAARRFIDEARITGQLQHPAIPPVHHIGATPDRRPFLVMKLIKGDTLSELLAGDSADRGRFVAVFAQVCHAVAYAHARNVIHRDLKPANVMVGAFGEVQVMDWGLAKLLTSKDRPEETLEDERTEIRTLRDADSATQAGSVLGTPAFMSPEQAGGEIGKVDERSDVFGLGAMLCAILTGKPPYVAANSDDVRLMAIRGETADAIARLEKSGTDIELIAICKHCLTVDREARPKDANEIAIAVTEHLVAAEERARRAELDQVRSQEQRRRRRMQFTLAGSFIGLFLVAGVSVLLATLWKRAESDRHSAELARGEAELARGEAESARDAEQLAREQVARIAYGRTMQVAYQLWQDGDIGASRKLLQVTNPHRRGWEWRYVHRLCNPSLVTYKHSGGVTGAAFAPNGKQFVTSGGDKTVQIWDIVSGAIVQSFSGHENQVWSPNYSRDGLRLVAAGYDKTAKIWDVKTGNTIRTLKGHSEFLSSASFSPDGQKVVTGSYDQTAKIWDLRDGTTLHTLQHSEMVGEATFSPNGEFVLTACGDKTANIWDAKTGTLFFSLKGHTDAVRQARFNGDGTRIVTGSDDNSAIIWDVKKRTALTILKGHTSSITSVAWSPDETRIITASHDRSAKIWSVETGAELQTLKAHSSYVFGAVYSPDGSRIVTASWDRTARIWQGTPKSEPLLLDGGNDGSKTKLTLNTTSLSPDESLLAICDSSNIVRVVNAHDNSELAILKGHSSTVGELHWNLDGTRIVTSSLDKTVRIWNSRTGVHLSTIRTEALFFANASLSPDGSRLVTCSMGKEPAKVWDANSGKELLTLKGEAAALTRCAVFSSEGTRIVTGGGRKSNSEYDFKSDGEDFAVRVWDASTGVELTNISGHTDTISDVSFNADGSRIVTASHDHSARVWDLETGRELLVLKGHVSGLYSASFSPDGSRIVTGSNDNTAKIWNATTGDEVLSLRAPGRAISSARFSRDGIRVIGASHDGVRIWDARPVSREFLEPERPLPRPFNER